MCSAEARTSFCNQNQWGFCDLAKKRNKCFLVSKPKFFFLSPQGCKFFKNFSLPGATISTFPLQNLKLSCDNSNVFTISVCKILISNRKTSQTIIFTLIHLVSSARSFWFGDNFSPVTSHSESTGQIKYFCTIFRK